MEKASLQGVTLAEIAAAFLSGIPRENRDKTQTEVYKCIRWLGLQRKPTEISPSDVARYAEQITPPEGKSVKAFLSYMRKQCLISINLAVHVRSKKATLKVATLRQGSGGQAVLTEEGRDMLEAELVKMEERLPDVIKDIQKAAADKDFRENAPLAAAREEKSFVEGRIKDLKATLETAKTMDGGLDASKVEMGDTILILDTSSGSLSSYLLVDPREAKPREGKLSVVSPLGKVLLNKEKGQTVSVDAPAGTFSYRIEDIRRN